MHACHRIFCSLHIWFLLFYTSFWTHNQESWPGHRSGSTFRNGPEYQRGPRKLGAFWFMSPWGTWGIQREQVPCEWIQLPWWPTHRYSRILPNRKVLSAAQTPVNALADPISRSVQGKCEERGAHRGNTKKSISYNTLFDRRNMPWNGMVRFSPRASPRLWTPTLKTSFYRHCQDHPIPFPVTSLLSALSKLWILIDVLHNIPIISIILTTIPGWDPLTST